MKTLTAKIADRSVLLAATLGLAARQYDVPNELFWSETTEERPHVLLALICTVGLFGALTPFQAYASRQRAERRSVVRHQVLLHFGKMLVVARNARPPVETGDLSLHIWLIRRSLRHPWRGYLRRVATYRLGSTPITRSFAPVRGVGVVGLCWKRNGEVSYDVRTLAGELTNRQEFDTRRATAGADAVMGFSWSEFQRVSHRGAVFASPIRDRSGDFIGCISVDARHGHDDMDVDDFWHEVNSLCSRLGHDDFDVL
ncbi:hypothetical protein OG875_10590 [Streptomyces sp. NBC_01498]|uniref:hypothetical protein n=1 Tax=Streptomyces sp. NBC_01498 TaxID=2975870 RepID=UPI002E7AC7DB|nr:hypothetical protein [Streptomyces sp. NBC_01498]WTL25005.1 hypothetical protein OG875_10590 [Streptomyces sp. NBC_01498]